MKPMALRSRGGCRGRGCRGEVFAAAILFMAMMLTILVAVHVVLLSIASSAAQSAAEFGLSAARTAPAEVIGAAAASECTFDGIYGQFTPTTDPTTGTTERECAGMVAASAAMHTTLSMVTQLRLPEVRVNDEAGVMSVRTFGGVHTPVLGLYEVVGSACAPLDVIGEVRARVDIDACFTED